MTPLLTALQATTVEALPEEAANAAGQAAQALSTGAADANSLNLLHLVLQASIPVQLVMLLLLFGSVASWVIIFRKEARARPRRARSRPVSRSVSGPVPSCPSSMPGPPSATATSPGWKRSSRPASASSAACASAGAPTAACSWKVRSAPCAPPARARSTVWNTTSSSSPTSVRYQPVRGPVRHRVGHHACRSQGLANMQAGDASPPSRRASAEALVATAMGLFAAIPAVCGLQPLRHEGRTHVRALRRVLRGVLFDPAAPGRRSLTPVPAPEPAHPPADRSHVVLAADASQH